MNRWQSVCLMGTIINLEFSLASQSAYGMIAALTSAVCFILLAEPASKSIGGGK